MDLPEAARTALQMKREREWRRLRKELRWHMFWRVDKLLRAFLADAEWKDDLYYGDTCLTTWVDGIEFRFRKSVYRKLDQVDGRSNIRRMSDIQA